MGDIYTDDNKSTVVPLVLKRAANGSSLDSIFHIRPSSSMSTSGGENCDIFFQLENENIRQGALSGGGKDAFVNELFNRTGIVEKVTIQAGAQEGSLVIVLIPRLTSVMSERLLTLSDMGTLEGVSSNLSPTRLREFRGSIELLIDNDSGDQLGVLSLPFKGNFCCSLMTTDRAELCFDECVPYQTYVREFSVWNRYFSVFY